jgi:hypothetical protein
MALILFAVPEKVRQFAAPTTAISPWSAAGVILTIRAIDRCQTPRTPTLNPSTPLA